ncbi:hypothetical protein AAF712_016497 [Marasmius tenuissimus]|uniref:Uncharacterized protein n=1 Tax=Marasmius tenuissimus TaxID=585030 RepID=A0ABR2Z6I9_9AGAR
MSMNDPWNSPGSPHSSQNLFPQQANQFQNPILQPGFSPVSAYPTISPMARQFPLGLNQYQFYGVVSYANANNLLRSGNKAYQEERDNALRLEAQLKTLQNLPVPSISAPSVNTEVSVLSPTLLNNRKSSIPKEDISKCKYKTEQDWTKYTIDYEKQHGKAAPKLGFLEDLQGESLTSGRKRKLSNAAYLTFGDMYANWVDPETWGSKTSSTLEFFYLNMASQFVEMRACNGMWKSDRFAAVKFSDWNVNQCQAGKCNRLIPDPKGKRIKEEHVVSDNDEVKPPRKRTRTATAPSLPALNTAQPSAIPISSSTPVSPTAHHDQTLPSALAPAISSHRVSSSTDPAESPVLDLDSLVPFSPSKSTSPNPQRQASLTVASTDHNRVAASISTPLPIIGPSIQCSPSQPPVPANTSSTEHSEMTISEPLTPAARPDSRPRAQRKPLNPLLNVSIAMPTSTSAGTAVIPPVPATSTSTSASMTVTSPGPKPPTPHDAASNPISSEPNTTKPTSALTKKTRKLKTSEPKQIPINESHGPKNLFAKAYVTEHGENAKYDEWEAAWKEISQDPDRLKNQSNAVKKEKKKAGSTKGMHNPAADV